MRGLVRHQSDLDLGGAAAGLSASQAKLISMSDLAAAWLRARRRPPASRPAVALFDYLGRRGEQTGELESGAARVGSFLVGVTADTFSQLASYFVVIGFPL